MNIQVPADTEQLTEFRVLQARHGERAYLLFVKLWVALAYAARNCGVGFLKGNHLEILKHQFGDAFKSMVEAEWLMEKPGGAFFCPRFERDNAHLAPDYVPQHMRAAAASRQKRAMDKVEAKADQMALTLAPEVFKRPDGGDMGPDEAKLATMIIGWLDDATFRQRRNPGEYTEGLMQSAWRLSQEWNQEQIKEACMMISRKHTHPVLKGLTTEMLLPDLRNLMEKVK